MGDIRVPPPLLPTHAPTPTPCAHGDMNGAANVPQSPPCPPDALSEWDDLFANLGEETALARALTRQIWSFTSLDALKERWQQIIQGNYQTLGEEAQRVVHQAYAGHAHTLRTGGAQ